MIIETGNYVQIKYQGSQKSTMQHDDEIKQEEIFLAENTVQMKEEEITKQNLNTMESEIKDEDHICRLCGKTGAAYDPIFDNNNLSVAEKISRCLPIIVLSTDDLPSHICPPCLCRLNISYKLIMTSLEVDSRLRQQLTVSRKRSSFPIDVNNLQNTEGQQIPSSDNFLDTYTDRLNSKTMYGPVECEMCSVIFTDMEEFDSHIETKHLLPWPCSLCDMSFETSVKLVAHKEADHAGNVLICTSCVDAERSAHGLCSLAEMQNSRKYVKRIRTKPARKPVEDDLAKKNLKKLKNKDNEKNKEKNSGSRWLAMCDICKIAFGTEELLLAHQRIHQPKALHCYICQTDAASIYDLFLHKRQAHNIYKRVQLKFACKTCGKYFSNNWQWLNHEQKVNCKKRSFSHVCKYCNNSYTTKSKLTRHLRNHKDEIFKDPAATIYRCVACPKVFSDKESYQKHQNVHDPECSDKLKCDLCGKSFSDKRRLREHHQGIHQGLKPHLCDLCGRAFHRSSNLTAHRKKHFGRKCEHCDETFPKLRFLADHVRDVHNLEPNFNLPAKKTSTGDYFVCRYCGKTLTSYQSLLNHEHIHTGEKPYACKLCDKTFRSYTGRWSHSLRHVEGKFICEHCGKSFSCKSNLSKHVNVHMPVENRRHKCTVCDKRFVRKTHLNVHMRIHEGVRPYTCDICEVSFTQIGDMRRHRARHMTTGNHAKTSHTKPESILPNNKDDAT